MQVWKQVANITTIVSTKAQNKQCPLVRLARRMLPYPDIREKRDVSVFTVTQPVRDPKNQTFNPRLQNAILSPRLLQSLLTHNLSDGSKSFEILNPSLVKGMIMKYLIAASTLVALGLSGAQAAVVDGSDVCGELPNSSWSWVITTDTVTSGGEVSTDTYDALRTAGNNQFLETFEVTIVAPTYEQTTTNCTALNPAGKINLDHSTTIAGELVEVDPGSTGDPEKISNVKVCGPNLEPCS